MREAEIRDRRCQLLDKRRQSSRDENGENFICAYTTISIVWRAEAFRLSHRTPSVVDCVRQGELRVDQIKTDTSVIHFLSFRGVHGPGHPKPPPPPTQIYECKIIAFIHIDRDLLSGRVLAVSSMKRLLTRFPPDCIRCLSAIGRSRRAQRTGCTEWSRKTFAVLLLPNHTDLIFNLDYNFCAAAKSCERRHLRSGRSPI